MSTATLPRPAERVAIVSMLLLFLCGVAMGGLVMSLWYHRGPHTGTAPGINGLAISTKEWKQTLDLTDDQTRQLNSLLDDFSRYYDNLLADGNSRVMNILTPPQRVKYERMLKEHRR